MFIPYIICLFIFSFSYIKPNYVNYLQFFFAGTLIFHTVKALPYPKSDNSLLETITKEVSTVKGIKGQFYSLNERYLRVNFNLNITSPSKHVYAHFMNDDVAKEIIEALQTNKTKYVLFDKGDASIIPESLQSFITVNYKEVLTYQEHILLELE